ncbi:MAG: M24 family metallopeptidase [Gemmatimonas sp.]
MDLPSRTLPAPRIPDRLRPLLEAEYPVFSAPEMARRRAALTEAMGEAGARHIILSGGDRKGSAIQWLTGWPPGGGHFVIFTPSERDVLYVKNPNNAALARIMAPHATVGWGPEGSQALMIAELLRRGAKGQTVGVIGSYGHGLHEKLVAAGVKPIDFNRAYTKLRLVKSEEELDWTRIGCALTDLGVEALEREVEPGMTEHQLADIIERAYVPWGAMTQIHYTGVTSMENPACCVPSQLARNRRVQAGDVVFTEIAASFWSYPGQVQRTIAVAADPTPLYRDLYAAADEAFHGILKVVRDGATPGDILDAATSIDRAGFTICDDLVHGYVGGYLPPVLGTRERPSGPVPEMTLRENMTVVVQPSVMTKDGKAGVQAGELVRITKTGVERLHHAAWGFRRAG